MEGDIREGDYVIIHSPEDSCGDARNVVGIVKEINHDSSYPYIIDCIDGKDYKHFVYSLKEIRLATEDEVMAWLI